MDYEERLKAAKCKLDETRSDLSLAEEAKLTADDEYERAKTYYNLAKDAYFKLICESERAKENG